jgi:hypothetical protein
MVRKDIQQLLQECLEGYDAGLTPEECLSAYPRLRAELEPLFRQAISLRVAYAASPSREFRYRAREKLMFAAGRDVTTALSAEPDPQFVSSTRQRLLNRAGATAQEALRDVPPPRLPFWMNARRRLLETAASAPPRPAHAPMTIRYALSAAVIVLAMAIAGAGFFLQGSPVNHRTENASAELNYISDKLEDYEQLKASGQVVSSSMLDDLATRTKDLVEKSTTESPDQEVLAKLPELIDRQRQLAEDDDESNDQALASVQQRLNEADQQVAAAAVVSPSPEPTSTEDASAVAPTPEKTVEPTAEPTETATATPEATETVTLPALDPVDPSTLSHGQIVKQLDPNIVLLDQHWMRVTTDALRFPMPESWVITNMITDENGLAMLNSQDYLLIKTDVDGLTLIVANSSGKVDTVIDGRQYTLREPGPSAAPMAPDDLYKLVGADTDAFALFNMLNSMEVFRESATPTPEATSTPESTVTSTPTAAETATPAGTPEATSTPSDIADDSNP